MIETKPFLNVNGLKLHHLRSDITSHSKRLKQFFIKPYSSRSTVLYFGFECLVEWSPNNRRSFKVCLAFSADDFNNCFSSHFQPRTHSKRIMEACNEACDDVVISVTLEEVRSTLIIGKNISSLYWKHPLRDMFLQKKHVELVCPTCFTNHLPGENVLALHLPNLQSDFILFLSFILFRVFGDVVII